jgi:hypothetical protein
VNHEGAAIHFADVIELEEALALRKKEEVICLELATKLACKPAMAIRR